MVMSKNMRCKTFNEFRIVMVIFSQKKHGLTAMKPAFSALCKRLSPHARQVADGFLKEKLLSARTHACAISSDGMENYALAGIVCSHTQPGPVSAAGSKPSALEIAAASGKGSI